MYSKSLSHFYYVAELVLPARLLPKGAALVGGRRQNPAKTPSANEKPLLQFRFASRSVATAFNYEGRQARSIQSDGATSAACAC
jgi:hypothetical protein